MTDLNGINGFASGTRASTAMEAGWWCRLSLLPEEEPGDGGVKKGGEEHESVDPNTDFLGPLVIPLPRGVGGTPTSQHQEPNRRWPSDL
jgi:hypothetical protein